MLYKKTIFVQYLAVLLLALLATGRAKAQTTEEENRYYQKFPDHLTTRYYFSKIYTDLKINDRTEDAIYKYKPNTTLNMGVGASYKWLTLNLAYGFKFLNPERGRGNTRYLDLQTHAYPRKMVIDLFGQFYRGYYLAPAGKAAAPGKEYYVRPDLDLVKIGASVQYVFNHEKFSYRAAFLQNEWQKKSAGTFLLGFEMYGGGAETDSTLVPAALLQDQSRNFQELRFYEVGPNAGYAYTLVIKRHLFFTASASANLGVGYTTQERNMHKNKEWGVNSNLFFRAIAGYNAARWSISASYINNNVGMPRSRGFSNSMMTGNYRLNIGYRFLPGPKLKRYLRYVDRWD